MIFIIYKQCPLLRNIKYKAYCNIKLKDEIFKNFYSDLDNEGLVKKKDFFKTLKAKIKTGLPGGQVFYFCRWEIFISNDKSLPF